MKPLKNYFRASRTKQKLLFSKSTFVLNFTLAILLNCTNFLNGQSFEATDTDFIPPSPNAASLVNFTEASVDHKSGVMNLSIPLIGVQSKTLSAGLQASYSARGVKVKEDASTIGLGWTLTGYGVITRTIMDRRDELASVGYLNNNFDWQNSDLIQAYNSNFDLEPDIYSYNFGRYSGKFIMDQEQNIVHLEKTDLKFELDGFGWKAIEPNGTVHEFYRPEISNKYIEGSASVTATTAWYETKIEPFDKSDVIEFSYQQDGVSFSPSNHSFSKTATSAGPFSCTVGVSFSSGTTDFSAQNTYLSSIETAFHSIELIYSNRADIINGKKLDAIELKNKTTNQILKTIDFTYTYFGPNNQKLKLDQIQEEGRNGETIPPFIFTYNTGILNDKNDSKMDHWGFQNNNGSLSVSNIPDEEATVFFNDFDFGNPNREADSKSLDGLMTRIDYPTGWFESFEYELNDAGYIGNVNIHEFWFETCTLELTSNQQDQFVEGTFPVIEEFPEVEVQVERTGSCQFQDPNGTTGECLITFNIYDDNESPIYFGGENGDQSIEILNLSPGIYTATIENWEPNIDASLIILYKKKIEPNEKLAKIIGGARIQSITDPDGTRSFNYCVIEDGKERSSGILVDRPLYKKNMTIGSPSCFECPAVLYSSSSITNSFSSDVLMYKKVKEVFPDQSYIEYEFNYASDTYSYSNLPRISRQQIRGNLIESKFYDNSNNLVKKETYNYTFDQLSAFNVPVIEWLNPNCQQFPPTVDLYDHKIYWKKLDEVITEDFDLSNFSNSVSKSTLYTYRTDGLHSNAITSSTTNSEGKIFETRYKYYDQYTDHDDNTTNHLNVRNWLQINNIIEPWRTTIQVYDSAADTSPTLVDGTSFEYNSFGIVGTNLIYYPKTFRRYERTWNANGNIQTGSWKKQYEVNSYNTNVGKPSSITVDGWSDPTTYSWTSTGKLNIKTYKDFVTDYNYHSNTNLLSEIIEPDGQSTTFTYDNFMRLDEVKSRAGKIKKEYNYGYQPNFIEEISTFDDAGTVNDITNRVKTTFDGLGRDIQIDQVGHKWNSPNTNITTLKKYNNRGLLEKVYEPDDDASITGADKFTQYTYFPDPLGRIKSVKDPMGFITSSSYGTNSAEVDGFTANKLIRETMTDPDGIATSTYTDKLGRVVANRTFKGNETSITYTNYDDKSRVSTIIPPGAEIGDAGLIYKYIYDGADNILSTKIPDKGLMEYRYDNRNLQTAMRDANIKAKGKKWLNSQYDTYGRLHKQGFGASAGTVTELLIHNYYDNNDGLDAVNTAIPIYIGKLHKSKVNILNGFNKGNNNIITEYELDTYGRVKKETINGNHINLNETIDFKYDMADNILENKHTVGGTETTETFTFDPKGRLQKNDFALSGWGSNTVAEFASYSVKDELLIKNLGANGSNFLQTVNYGYNHNGWLTGINNNLIGTASNCSTISASTNGDLFALDISYNNPSQGHLGRRNGNISEIQWQVKGRGKNAYRFQYDFLNRLTEAKHYTPNTDVPGAWQHLGYYDTSYSYDERGNITTLTRKGLPGNGASCNAKQIDNLSYMYEIGTNKLTKVFDTKCSGVGQHINPITGANYNKRYITSDAKTNVNGGNTNNNNIQFKGGTYITLQEGFSYETGTGNSKFNAIIEPCPPDNDLNNEGFKGPESSYNYDGNGNLISDSQKQLKISYNHLNLPHKAEKNGSNKIEWLYTADGRKLQKKVTNNGQVSIKNYLGNMEFTESGGNNTLEAAYHSEGRVLNNGFWEYYLKDHLGNVRVVFHQNGTSGIYIRQENHYYPFGMQLNGNWAKNQSVKNDYLYNGKELNTEIGLNWSDYGFRYYDPSIGRFAGVDPISGQFPHVSTYNYAENSPIAHIDLWGLQAVFFQVAGRVGVSGSVIPGPTVAGAVGVAADFKGNVMVYHAESGGLGFGAYAGGGIEGGVNFGVDNVDGLLGWGVNVGAVAGVSPLGGPQFGAEGNLSISSDEGELLGSGDNGGGFTASAGGGIGFFGYLDLSYTSEIARFTLDDIEMAGQELINQLSELLGTDVSDSQRDYIMENVRNLQTEGPLSTNDNQETCEEECKQ